MKRSPFEKASNEDVNIWDNKLDRGPWVFVQIEAEHGMLRRQFAEQLERRMSRVKSKGNEQ